MKNLSKLIGKSESEIKTIYLQTISEFKMFGFTEEEARLETQKIFRTVLGLK